MSLRTQKILVGLLGLALFISVGVVGFVDSNKHLKSDKPEEPSVAVRDPQIELGAKTFEKYGCVTCHGVAGKGGIKNYNAQTGNEIPPLNRVVEGFTKEELVQKILNGVPKIEKLDPNGPNPPLYMPSYQNIISQDELEALVAYLNWLMPKGEKEAW